MRCDKTWSEMVRTFILAVALATLAAPATARDASFTFEGLYAGAPVKLTNLSADECAAILAKPVVKLGDRLMVASSDISGRRCTSEGPNEAPDQVKHFAGMIAAVKFFNRGNATFAQVGNGPKVVVSVSANMWTWETDTKSYAMVDNLSVIDKATGQKQCFQEPKKRFSCEVNP